MNERTFSDSEIQALMERAAQLQADTQNRTDHGLTFGELEQVAAESGIDPMFLRAALREAESGIGLRNVAGQTKTHVFVEQTVPGVLTDDEWEEVVLRLRQQFSNDMAMAYGMGSQYGPGVVEQLGKTRTWRHTTSMGVVTTVTIRSTEEAQHVRIERRVGLARPTAEGIGYGLIVAVLMASIAGGVAASALVGALVFLVTWLLSAPGITVLDRRWRQGKLDEIEDVADAIAGIIRNDEAIDELATAEVEAEADAPEANLREVFESLPDVDDVELRRHKPTRTRS